REVSFMAQRSGRQQPHIERHPKSPDANPEKLRSLAGIIALKGPVPSTRFLDEDEPPQAASPHATRGSAPITPPSACRPTPGWGSDSQAGISVPIGWAGSAAATPASRRPGPSGAQHHRRASPLVGRASSPRSAPAPRRGGGTRQAPSAAPRHLHAG